MVPECTEDRTDKSTMKDMFNFSDPITSHLVAHLAKESAWEQKEHLENLLVAQAVQHLDESQKNQDYFAAETLQFIQKDEKIQRILNIASYRGCNLVYSSK